MDIVIVSQFSEAPACAICDAELIKAIPKPPPIMASIFFRMSHRFLIYLRTGIWCVYVKTMLVLCCIGLEKFVV
jgi:hypothetical protein